MQTIKEQVKKDINLRKYSDLINKIAKVEYKTLNVQHLVEFEELVNIGFQTINILCGEKKASNFNESYLSTAIKWAIRNELRNRYRWYGIRHARAELTESDARQLKDAVYKTILSTDEMYDSEHTFEVKDTRKNPEENYEFASLSNSIKSAVATLPKRERELIESKFFKEKKLHELSDEFSISPSRISRIIKSGLDKVKAELIKSEAL